MRALAAATIAAVPETCGWRRSALDGRAYALSHEKYARGRMISRRTYGAGAAWLRAVADEGELAMPRTFWSGDPRMTEGLLLQRFF